MGSRLDCVLDWSERAGESNYNVSTLARQCNVSLRQLERYFKATFNQSPEVWLSTLRLEKAQELLLKGCTIKEASFLLGFKHPSHFCNSFKRHNGITPRQYATEKAKVRLGVAQAQ